MDSEKPDQHLVRAVPGWSRRCPGLQLFVDPLPFSKVPPAARCASSLCLSSRHAGRCGDSCLLCVQLPFSARSWIPTRT
jgi:hypothetical protein